MLKNLKKRTEGFTIVEVIIVLAIAALILLIVLLAIPALQRNSRNNGRKNDVARMGGAITEFVSNRNGTIPTNAVGDRQAIIDAAGQLNQYDFTGYGIANFPVTDAGTAGATTVTNTNQIRLVTGAICNTGTAGQVSAGSARQMALQYAVEDADGGAGQSVCQPV